MPQPTSNLEVECAIAAEKIAKEADDKTITDALGVLEEQGVYAFFLFVSIEKDKRPALKKHCIEFLRKQPNEKPFLNSEINNDLTALQELSKDINKLLFAKQLLSQTLIFARYHAKAKPEKNAEPSI
jgi:hypothetical protein